MDHASTIDIGARKRRQDGINEDGVATAVFENHHRDVARPLGVFVLADGVGGEAAGDVASFIATTVVRKRLVADLLGPATDLPGRFGVEALADDGAPTAEGGLPGEAAADDGDGLSAAAVEEAIQAAVNDAHQEIQSFARDVGARPATTVVACVYVDGTLHYGWVGDSRAYLLNERHGEIQQLTRDMAVTTEMVERGEIDDVEARVHEDATAITDALGGSGHGKPEVDVAFDSVELYAEDVLLVTSDGVVDAYPRVGPLRDAYREADDKDAAREELLDVLVTDDEIRDHVLDAPDLRTAAADLVEFANDRGGKDNLSIVLARDPGAPSTPDRLPPRGADAGGEALASQETIIEPATTDGESDEDADDGTAEDGDTDDAEGEAELPASRLPDGRPGPTAAVRIGGDDTVYEVGDGFTVGRVGEEDGETPNVGLVLDDERITHHHAAFEHDGDDWFVRDVGGAGTFVRTPDGDWLGLEGDDDTVPLADGTAVALQDPREDPSVVLQFYDSVERAREAAADAEGTFLERLLE
jgi:serine/threonine protein phosphatase PrpC